VGYNKLLVNFMGFVKLAAIEIWLQNVKSSPKKSGGTIDAAVVYLVRRKEGIELLRRFVGCFGKTGI
jgi:hypothetical protein